MDKGMLGHCQLCWVYPILGSTLQVRGTCSSGCHCSNISFIHPWAYGTLCRMGEPRFVIYILILINIFFFLVLSYDNMCHLDSLKMFKKPLPAKGNFAHIWQKVTKGGISVII